MPVMANCRTPLILLILSMALSSCVACTPRVSDKIEKDIKIRPVGEEDDPPTRDGGPVSVDDDGNALPVLYFSEKRLLEKRPRSSADVEISYATLEVLEPDDRDLSVVRDIQVFLLPKGASYRGDVSNWKLAATSDGFEEGQRTADFAIEPKPSNVDRFIRDHDEYAGVVWVAILVTLHDDVNLPKDGFDVRLEMDLRIEV